MATGARGSGMESAGDVRTDSSLHPVGRTPRASEAIAEQLRRLIVAGEIVRGDVLEPTNTLLERFDVSRPILREAFRILESEQLISVRRGSRAGVRVLQPSAEAAIRIGGQTLQAAGATLGDLYDAQLVIEPAAVQIVAKRADPRDMIKLRAHLRRLEALLTEKDHIRLAGEFAHFHHLLVELTGNKLLTLTSGLIAHVLERHQALVRSRPAGEDAGLPAFRDPAVGVRSIAKLVRLIEAADADAAERHWCSHLEGSNRYWLDMQDRFETVRIF